MIYIAQITYRLIFALSLHQFVYYAKSNLVPLTAK